ncbi:class I SAM-dependent methyltransferase [Candidatus Peregrinibacteria bacterium]|nr:class I SAM-dependent methyltransferase [Candidatus Peregrinibacteria bacterium]
MAILMVRRSSVNKGIPPKSVADPTFVMDSAISFQPFMVLRAALQFDIFTHISKGKKSAQTIAKAVKANLRAVGYLLDGLAVLGYLVKSGKTYELSATAREHLVKGKPDYMGGFLLHGEEILEKWLQLPEAIKKGRLPKTLNDKAGAVVFFSSLVKNLYTVNTPFAEILAKKLGIGTKIRAPRILDVATGSAVWSLPMAKLDKMAIVTANDYGEVLKVTREYINKNGCYKQYDYLPGDLRRVDFGKNIYDIAILGHICHSEGVLWSERLISKVGRSLKSGGRIVILEFVPNETRTAPPFPILFAINMLVNTDEGGTYTISEYSRWLKKAGFGRIYTLDIKSYSPAIVGIKK